MKRKCKNVDITNIEFIKTAIARCLKKKKETRKDIVDLRERYPNLDTLAYEIQAEIQSRSITLYPLRMREKIDTSSGKLRVIGMQNIRNQIYDYIAVMALEELSRRLGRYQCASVKGRGQIYGLKAIRKWMKNPKETRYMLKLDIKKFYPSVKHETIMSFLHKRVKNDPLLWLIGEILKSFGETGLSIGSYLSQTLANLLLSDLYHFIEGRTAAKTRRGVTRFKRLCSHVLFYMDDLLNFGAIKSYLKKLAKEIQIQLGRMGLTLKFKPAIVKIVGRKIFVDMLGFKIYRRKASIRKRNWKRARRSLLRFDRKPWNIDLARRLVSYWGFIKHTDSREIRKTYKAGGLKRKASKLIAKFAGGEHYGKNHHNIAFA